MKAQQLTEFRETAALFISLLNFKPDGTKIKLTTQARKTTYYFRMCGKHSILIFGVNKSLRI